MKGEHQEGPGEELAHLPTELVNQQIDKVLSLFAGRNDRIYTDSILQNVAASMADWDAESRRRMMVAIIRKEFDSNPQSFTDFSERKEEDRAFPLGVRISPGFLAAMPPSLREETFWDATTEISRDIDFSDEEDNRPMVLRDFLGYALLQVPVPERQEIEHEMVGEFAHNPAISDDGRWSVVGSYLHWKYHRHGIQEEWQSYKAAEGPKPQDNIDHFMKLQGDIVRILSDPDIKDKFRGSMLQFLCYDALDEDAMRSIEAIILEPGQSTEVGVRILHWIGFRANKREDGGKHARETLQKVIDTRGDAPELQLVGMSDLLFLDSTAKEDGEHYADIDNFAEIAAGIARSNPEALKNEGASFYMTLALTQRGKEIIQEMILEGEGLEQFLAIEVGLGKRDIDVPPHILSKALSFLAESYESGADEKYLHSFCRTLDMKEWQPGESDYFMLSRIRSALEKIATDKSTSTFHNAEDALESVKEILSRSLK